MNAAQADNFVNGNFIGLIRCGGGNFDFRGGNDFLRFVSQRSGGRLSYFCGWWWGWQSWRGDDHDDDVVICWQWWWWEFVLLRRSGRPATYFCSWQLLRPAIWVTPLLLLSTTLPLVHRWESLPFFYVFHWEPSKMVVCGNLADSFCTLMFPYRLYM